MSINRTRLLALFTELVCINAPSRQEKPMAERVRAILADLGIDTVEDGAGEKVSGACGNLIARMEGDPQRPPILFCAHLDTVEPTDGLVITRKDGIIASDGSTILGADDRAGVAAILEMARAVIETNLPHPPLELVFTVAEEVGLMGSTALDPEMLRGRYGFIPDTTGAVGTIITRAPAQKHLHVVIHGKAAHAGVCPEEGISAIVVAARAIAAMPLGRIDPETTANIGTVHGGKATNIIADRVELDGEARSRDPKKLDAQLAVMRACLEDAARDAGATVEVEVSDVYPAFDLDPASLPVSTAVNALEAMGIAPTVTATGGGSDANFLNAYGIPTVILSTGYQQAHTHAESQDEEELVKLAEWLYQIVKAAK
jgi:tripeptide aminopeptidase